MHLRQYRRSHGALLSRVIASYGLLSYRLFTAEVFWLCADKWVDIMRDQCATLCRTIYIVAYVLIKRVKPFIESSLMTVGLWMGLTY